ncbi:MAG: class II aldolase/adducin family protein [Bacteroidota bacterium]
MALLMEKAVRAGREIPLTEPERAARVQLAAAYRIFDHLGWTELIFNHITLRVPGPEKIFLINPFGLAYREVTASNLVAIDVEGNPVRPTEYPINRAGFVIHSAIHRSLQDAHCVMHTHTTSGMAVACLKSGLSHDSFNGAQLYGRVAYHEFEGITVDEGEQARMLASIGDKRAVILRNHGLLAWGASVPEAFMMLWTLQRACDVQVAAAAMGAMNPVSAAALEQAVRESGPDEGVVCELVFAALVRQVDAKDPGYRD